jgi:hypothetical protein
MLCLLAILSPIIAQAQTCDPASIVSTTPTSQFTDNGNGTVTDNKTGLMWKRCSEGQAWSNNTCTGIAASYTWQNALKQAQAVNNSAGFAGKKDWRVPNIKELRSIVERQCKAPAINLTVFPNTLSPTLFWSSSPTALYGDNDTKTAWIIYSDDGHGRWINKTNRALVRSVRGGL